MPTDQTEMAEFFLKLQIIEAMTPAQRAELPAGTRAELVGIWRLIAAGVEADGTGPGSLWERYTNLAGEFQNSLLNDGDGVHEHRPRIS